MTVLEKNKKSIIELAKKVFNTKFKAIINDFIETNEEFKNKRIARKNVIAEKKFIFTKGELYANKNVSGYEFIYFKLNDKQTLVAEISNLNICIKDAVIHNDTVSTEEYLALKEYYASENKAYYNTWRDKNFMHVIFSTYQMDAYTLEDFEDDKLTDFEKNLWLSVENVLLGDLVDTASPEEQKYKQILDSKGINMSVTEISIKLAELKQQNLPEAYWLDCLIK